MWLPHVAACSVGEALRSGPSEGSVEDMPGVPGVPQSHVGLSHLGEVEVDPQGDPSLCPRKTLLPIPFLATGPAEMRGRRHRDQRAWLLFVIP